MADQYNKTKKGPFIPRTESQKILTSEEMGSKIQNMVVTFLTTGLATPPTTHQTASTTA